MSVSSITAGVQGKLALPSATAPEPLLIDVGESARLCSCSTRHFRRLVDSGRAPRGIKLGNLLRFNRAVIEKWITAGCPNCRTAGKGAGQ